MTRKFYLGLCILGILGPWIPLFLFFRDEGLNFVLFFQSIFSNTVATAVAIDLLLSAIFFLIWVWNDLQASGVPRTRFPFLVLATFFIGLSFGLPLYLFFRVGSKSREA